MFWGGGGKCDCVVCVLMFNLQFKLSLPSYQPAGRLNSPEAWMLASLHTPRDRQPLPAGFFSALYHCDKTCWGATPRSMFASWAENWFEDFGADVLAWQPQAAQHLLMNVTVCLSVRPAGLTANVHSLHSVHVISFSIKAKLKLFKE